MNLVKKIKKAINESYSPLAIPAKCGHFGLLKGKVEIFGEEHFFKYKSGSTHAPPYCLDCLVKGAIRCAWCGESIVFDQGITLYTPTKDFIVPDYAVVYNEDPLQLVGCLRRNCADTGGDRAGFWKYPGQVRRVPSLFEIAMETGGVVMAENVSDPNGKVTVYLD